MSLIFDISLLFRALTAFTSIVVAQDEHDIFTIHMVVPPGMDVTQLSDQEVVNLACAGTLDPVEMPIDKVFCRGIWKVDVAVANKFRSDGGRVFLGYVFPIIDSSLITNGTNLCIVSAQNHADIARIQLLLW